MDCCSERGGIGNETLSTFEPVISGWALLVFRLFKFAAFNIIYIYEYNALSKQFKIKALSVINLDSEISLTFPHNAPTLPIIILTPSTFFLITKSH